MCHWQWWQLSKSFDAGIIHSAMNYNDSIRLVLPNWFAFKSYKSLPIVWLSEVNFRMLTSSFRWSLDSVYSNVICLARSTHWGQQKSGCSDYHTVFIQTQTACFTVKYAELWLRNRLIWIPCTLTILYIEGMVIYSPDTQQHTRPANLSTLKQSCLLNV